MIRTNRKIAKILGFAAAVWVCSLLFTAAASPRSSDRRIVIENDGWRLVGTLCIPPQGRLVPAVLLLHGADGSRSEYSDLAGQLAALGIASLRIDLRGHGESITKGEFGPPYDEKMRQVLIGTDSDINAALAYLKRSKGIDPKRIGVVGASYSGEYMATAARTSGYARAYVALSPGSFSEPSIKAIDTSGAAWLFVRSEAEPFLKGLHEEIRKESKRATLIEVPGNDHATSLLATTLGLSDIVAIWLKNQL